MHFSLSSSEDSDVSDHSDSETDQTSSETTKPRTIFKYQVMENFSTDHELQTYRSTLRSKGLHLVKSHDGGVGFIYTYKCKEDGCNYRLIIRATHDKQEAEVTERECGHDHSGVKPIKLTKEVKDIVEENSQETPRQIQMKLKVRFMHAIFDNVPISKKTTIANRCLAS